MVALLKPDCQPCCPLGLPLAPSEMKTKIQLYLISGQPEANPIKQFKPLAGVIQSA